MLKIACMSDNHGDEEAIRRFLEFEKDADIYIHCGDSETFNPYDLQSFNACRGNNDWAFELPNEIVINLDENHKALIVHGHRCSFYDREASLAYQAKEKGCNIVFFGHIHMPLNTIVDDVVIINPGSTTFPRGGSKGGYCVVTIDDDGKISVSFRSIIDGQPFSKKI